MEVVVQKEVIAQKDEFLALAKQASLDLTSTMSSSTGIALATLDTRHYFQKDFKF